MHPQWVQGERTVRLAASLQKLPNGQREAVLLRYLEGRPVAEIAHKKPRLPSELRPELAGSLLELICGKMMAKQQDERYASMVEVVRALDDFLGHPKARTADVLPRAGQQRNRLIRRVLIVAAGFSAIVFAGMGLTIITAHGRFEILSEVK